MHRTADGVVIADGLAVWDYNLQAGRVNFRLSRVGSPHFDGWFTIVHPDGAISLMNGERMATVHPFTRHCAEDALPQTWPQTRNGVIVWACCVSDIGPDCEHRTK